MAQFPYRKGPTFSGARMFWSGGGSIIKPAKWLADKDHCDLGGKVRWGIDQGAYLYEAYSPKLDGSQGKIKGWLVSTPGFGNYPKENY